MWPMVNVADGQFGRASVDLGYSSPPLAPARSGRSSGFGNRPGTGAGAGAGAGRGGAVKQD